MNQRSFFKSLALIGAAASVSPQIFLPRFEPVRWKAPILFKRYEYQCRIVNMPPTFDDLILTDGTTSLPFIVDRLTSDGVLYGHVVERMPLGLRT